METPLLESFVYLMIRPQKGGMRIDETRRQYTFAGAVIMELSLQGRLKMEGKKVKLSNPRLTGNKILDEAIRLMEKSGKPKKVKDLVSKLGMRSRKQYKSLLVEMNQKGLIRLKDKGFLFFKWQKPYLYDQRKQEELKRELREVVFEGRDPERNTVMLLGLLYAARGYTIICDEKCETQDARKKIKAILEKYPLASGVDKAIEEMLAAITATLISTTAVTNTVAATS